MLDSIGGIQIADLINKCKSLQSHMAKTMEEVKQYTIQKYSRNLPFRLQSYLFIQSVKYSV